jgi:hypothetical protein
MRHSTITLTMDTFGHFFPGQEAETIARLPEMVGRGIKTPDAGVVQHETVSPNDARAVKQ